MVLGGKRMDNDNALADYSAKVSYRVAILNEELNNMLLEESIINDDIVNLIDIHLPELYEMIDRLESFENISLEISFHKDKLLRAINLEIKRHICIKNKFLDRKSEIDLSECNEIANEINKILG
jgi:hypothetical protein